MSLPACTQILVDCQLDSRSVLAQQQEYLQIFLSSAALALIMPTVAFDEYNRILSLSE